MNTHRQIIKARDIQIYFGKSQSMSNKMLRKIRRVLNKMKYQPITITEFCTYYGVEEESIIKVIKSNDTESRKPSDNNPQQTNSNKTNTINTTNTAPQTSPNNETEPYKFQSKPWQTTIP